MEWTSTALGFYIKLINELYSTPLIEQCTKSKITNEAAASDPGKSGRSAEIEKLATDTKLPSKRGDHEQLVARLKEAASKVTEWSNPGEEQAMTARKKEVTLAEMAAMYRLRTLVSMSASLVELITRAKTWTKENVTLIEKSRTGNVLNFALNMFEATVALGEVFGLQSIDRTTAKTEFQHYLRPTARDEYECKENTALVIGDPRIFVPPLECKINHYRTCVHLIGSALITMVQTYMNSISLEQIDLRTREVKEILERLPPMYLKVKTDLQLSKHTSTLLRDYPPNKLQFPIAPQSDKGEGTKKRSGESVHTEGKKDTDAAKVGGGSKQRQKIVNTKEKIESEDAGETQERQGKTVEGRLEPG